MYKENIPGDGLYKQSEVITIAAGATFAEKFTVQSGRGDTQAFSLACAGAAAVTLIDYAKVLINFQANGKSIIETGTLLRWSPEYRVDKGIFLPLVIEANGTVLPNIVNNSAVEMIVEVELWWYNPANPSFIRFE